MANTSVQISLHRPQKSLLNPMIQQRSKLKILFLIDEKQVVSVTLSRKVLTVEDAISEAVQKLNGQYKLNLKYGVLNYSLYGARKSGKRKSDYPSLAYQQPIRNTNLERFTLYPLYDYCSPLAKTSQSLREIQSNISINKQKSMKKQTAKEIQFGCFCIKK